MKKKLLSLLLCIVMVLSLMPTVSFAADTAYDVWVNGEQFTSDKLSITCGSGTATYDPDDAELTLNNAAITEAYYYGGAYSGVVSVQEINVIVKGNNSITLDEDYDMVGVYVTEANELLTLSGDGTLNITLGDTYSESTWAIWSYGDLVLEDVTLNADTEDEGICASGTITVDGAAIVSKAGYEAFYKTPIFLPDAEAYTVLTADNKDGIGAAEWDGTSSLSSYYYVSITPKSTTPTEPVKITKVAITGVPTTLTVGAPTSTEGITITTEPADAKYTVTAIYWYNYTDGTENDTTFAADKNYWLSVILSPNDGYYFEFDETVAENYTGEATFNGEEPDIAWSVYSYVTHANTDLYTHCKPITPTDIGEPPLPVKITEVVITDADITPVLGEKAGDHLAYTLPADCHYAATMNGWWDIFGSRIMDSDDVFEAGGLYCASWNFVADDGYAFASDATVTINGSTENVDTEHSYLDTTGNEPLFIISAKGVLVEAATYTVTFNANGGSVTPTSAVTGTDGKLVSLPTPTRSGSYRFDGWYTAANGGTKVTVDNVYTADTTIYAHWTYTGGGGGGYTPIIYTLTFNTNGGSAISSVSGTYGKVIDLDKYVPTKSGFDFGGWYSDSALTDPVDEIKLNGNKTVYAKWNKENPNTGAELPFTDVKETDWSYDDIYYVWEKGLMQGTSETTFAPKTNTSRAMIVTILWRLEGEPIVNYAMSFDDVADGQWYTEAIRWAQANNIVNGYSTEKFGPTDLITREQMAAILYRYAQSKGEGFTGSWMFPLDFEDAADVSDWANEAMHWCVMKGLINGVGNDLLDSQGYATREQVAAILHRFCENIVK